LWHDVDQWDCFMGFGSLWRRKVTPVVWFNSSDLSQFSGLGHSGGMESFRRLYILTLQFIILIISNLFLPIDFCQAHFPCIALIGYN
jgi:hypothetical protein